MSSNILLRTVFLQVPIISNPVGVSGGRGRSPGLDIGKVQREVGFSYVLAPSQDFCRLNYERSEGIVKDSRE